MALAWTVLRTSLADPVTAIAPFEVSGAVQTSVLVLGYASGRLVCHALPRLPATLAGPLVAVPALASSSNASSSRVYQESDQKVDIPASLLSADREDAPRTPHRRIPDELELRDMCVEGIRQIVFHDQSMYVAVGDVCVLRYDIIDGSFDTRASEVDGETTDMPTWPFRAPAELTWTDEHSYHRCPRTVVMLIPTAVPGSRGGAAVSTLSPSQRRVAPLTAARDPPPLSATGPCAALFIENTVSTWLMDVGGGTFCVVCVSVFSFEYAGL